MKILIRRDIATESMEELIPTDNRRKFNQKVVWCACIGVMYGEREISNILYVAKVLQRFL